MAFSNDGKDEGRPLRNDCMPLSASRAVPEGGKGEGKGEGGEREGKGRERRGRGRGRERRGRGRGRERRGR